MRTIVWLCVLILSLQSTDAFSRVSPFNSMEDGMGLDLRESTGDKLVFTQLNVLKKESAPQNKVPILPFRFLATTYFIPDGTIVQPTTKKYTIRDHKYGLTILVYPFFIFW